MQIKAGFRLEITSWENDADNYNTKVLDGLSEAQVKFYVEIAKAHYSKNGIVKKGFGNMCDPDDAKEKEYHEYMRAIYKKHEQVVATLWDYFEPSWLNNDDEFLDMISGITYDLGLSGSEYFYTRVTESIKISYTPVDIKLEDRTDEFV